MHHVSEEAELLLFVEFEALFVDGRARIHRHDQLSREELSLIHRLINQCVPAQLRHTLEEWVLFYRLQEHLLSSVFFLQVPQGHEILLVKPHNLGLLAMTDHPR